MKFFNQITRKFTSKVNRAIHPINKTEMICERSVPTHGTYTCIPGNTHSPQRWQTHIHDEISKAQAKDIVEHIKKTGGVPKVEVMWHCEEEIDEAGIGIINRYKWHARDISKKSEDVENAMFTPTV